MQQLAQRPAGAVAGEHVEVVDVHVAVAVRLADLRRVDVRQPVVGDDLARHVEDQPAERIALVGVGVDAPVLLLQVLVDDGGDVDQRAALVAQAGVPVAVDDVGARGVEMAGGDQRVLDHVLDALDVRYACRRTGARSPGRRTPPAGRASARSNSPVAPPARAIAWAILSSSKAARRPSRLATCTGKAGGVRRMAVDASGGVVAGFGWRRTVGLSGHFDPPVGGANSAALHNML